MEDLPIDVREHVFGFLKYREICHMMAVSRALHIMACNFAQKFRRFHKGAVLHYWTARRGARIVWIAKGMLHVLRVMPKTVEYEHFDQSGFITRHSKRVKCNPVRHGVIEFELGDCGVRYGGTGLKFTSDDCRWTLKK